MRIYTRALSAADVYTIACGTKSYLNCVGLTTYINFNQNTSDVSGAGWFGTLVMNGQTTPVIGGNTLNPRDKTPVGTFTGGATTGAYIALQPRYFGVAMSFCADVQFTSFANSWARVFDFANGNPSNNIFLSQTGTTNTLSFAYYNGGTEYLLQISNFWHANVWQSVCGTITSTGLMAIYLNGTLAGTFQGGVQPPVVQLNYNYIGRSNWAAPSEGSDGFFAGYIDNFRMYSYALNSSEVMGLASM